MLVQIRAEMMAGGARLDTGNQRPYSLSEAQSAFDRYVLHCVFDALCVIESFFVVVCCSVARQHGWHK